MLAAGLPVALVFLNGPAPAALDDAMQRQARQQAGKLLVVRVPLQDSPQAARRFGIGAGPAVVTMRDGQTLSTASAISAADFDAHTAFLLRTGPKPAARTQSRPEQAGNGSSARPQAVTDATFDREVMAAGQPVLVDFWAPWCGPCRMTDPILEKLAREYGGRLKVAKVNVDENPMLSQRYGVQSIPTMLVVRNGKIVDRWVGALPEGALRGKVAGLVS